MCVSVYVCTCVYIYLCVCLFVPLTLLTEKETVTVCVSSAFDEKHDDRRESAF